MYGGLVKYHSSEHAHRCSLFVSSFGHMVPSIYTHFEVAINKFYFFPTSPYPNRARSKEQSSVRVNTKGR